MCRTDAAEAHPERVLGLVLRGVFLCRPLEIHWFLYDMRFIYPEAWRAFAEFLPEAERGDLLGGYHRRLIDPNPAVHMPAAHATTTRTACASSNGAMARAPASIGPPAAKPTTMRMGLVG